MPSDRVKFVRHRNVEILHIDWADAAPAELLETTNEAKAAIASRPPASVLTLTTVQGARVDRAVTDAL